MSGFPATYVDADTFTVRSDHTDDFVANRRVKAYCGVDGYKYGTVESSSYANPLTTVNMLVANDDLTINLTKVWYGEQSSGSSGTLPIHSHDGTEGSGGEISEFGTITEDIDMDDTYQVVNLQAPSVAGEAIRATATITETNLETVTDNSIADAMHRHSELVASDGAPDPAFSIGATGKAKFPDGTDINEFSIDGTLGGNSDDAVPTEQAVKEYVATPKADIAMGGTYQVTGLQLPAANGEAIRQTAKITEAKLEALDDAIHDQGTDTTLGTMTADIDMDGSYQVVGLQAPAAAGEAIRQTTTVTEDNLGTLTDNSMADTLHRHSELVASDGAPDPALSVDADGKASFPTGTGINEFSIDDTLAGNSDDAVPTEQAVKAYVDGVIHTRSHTMVSTSDHTAGNWKLFASNGSGEVTEITHGAADKVLTGNGVAAAPTWEDAAGGGGSEVGSVAYFAFPTVPTGWLECNGASVLRSTYADLFTAISDDYGTVDGTHFNLPDYRGEFLRSWDNGAGTDPDAASRTDRGDGTGGDVVGSKQADELKAHTHVAPENTAFGYSQVGAGFSAAGDTGSTGGNETRPTNINVLVCIKY